MSYCYTDIDTGKQISIRDASQMGVNTYYSDNSITVYDKTTDTYHRVAPPQPSEDDAVSMMEDLNREVRAGFVQDVHKPSGVRERERWEARKAELEK